MLLKEKEGQLAHAIAKITNDRYELLRKSIRGYLFNLVNKLKRGTSLKHSLCAYALIVTVMLTLLCTSCEATNGITIKSQLEIVTFWSDFVFVKWYFTVNLSEPDMRMKMLIPGDVVEENFSSSGGIFTVNKELDPLTNYTTFFIESPLPLGTISNDFPSDRYEANYFIGCNFLPQNLSLDLGGNIPGPTDNYQASWELRTDLDFPEKLLDFPPFVLNGMEDFTHWFRLHLSIFHRSPFQEYVRVLVKQVPLYLQIFGWVLTILIFLPIFYDYVSNRSLRSKRIVLIERVMVPLSAAIIVFIPVYILALHVFEAPLTIPKIETNLIEVLYLYLIILAIGIVLRVLSSEAEALKPQEEIAHKNESSSTHEMNKDTRSLTTSQLLSLRSDLRADIRSLDDLNFRIIATISTVSLGIITAGTALKSSDYMVFFFAGIAIVNCMAITMLLKNRISVLEKTWYVSYLESKLPKENRRFSPFGFTIFEEPMPKTAAYRHMISVHKILIIVGFMWALASLHSFFEISQHIFANAIASIASLRGNPITDLSSLLPYDFILSLALLAFFGSLTLYVLIFNIQRAYEDKWKQSIWAREPDLLKAIKEKFLLAGEKK